MAVRLDPFQNIVGVHWKEQVTTEETTGGTEPKTTTHFFNTTEEGPLIYWQCPCTRVGPPTSPVVEVESDVDLSLRDSGGSGRFYGAAPVPPPGAPPGTVLAYQYPPFMQSDGTLIYSFGGGGFFSSPAGSVFPLGPPMRPTFDFETESFPYNGFPTAGTPFYILYVPLYTDSPHPTDGTF